MLVFVDESGDPGFRFERHSSVHFTVAAIVFASETDADATAQVIERLRTRLGFGPAHEFHFSHASNRVRKAFFESVACCRFDAYGFVLNKAVLWSGKFSGKTSIYKHTAGWLFQNMAPILRDARVVMDRCGDRDFRNELKAHVRSKVGNCSDGVPRVRDFRTGKSQADRLIQLADMVCGAISRKQKPGERDDYCKLLQARIRQVRLWPGA